MERQFHRNESSWNVRSRGTKVPQERMRMFHGSSMGAKVLSVDFSLPATKVQGNEKAWIHKYSIRCFALTLCALQIVFTITITYLYLSVCLPNVLIYFKCTVHQNVSQWSLSVLLLHFWGWTVKVKDAINDGRISAHMVLFTCVQTTDHSVPIVGAVMLAVPCTCTVVLQTFLLYCGFSWWCSSMVCWCY